LIDDVGGDYICADNTVIIVVSSVAVGTVLLVIVVIFQFVK